MTTPAILSPNERIFAIDVYGLVYQVFHALPEMKGRDGENVNAVFGFLRDIFLILEKHHPDRLFCAFDLHAPTFRQEMYSEYKIQREKMPAELIEQIPRIRECLEKMRVPILGKEGFEADDILASLAQKAASLGGKCVLVTSDKDARQLLNDSVSIYSLRRDLFLDRDFLLEDWGIPPEQVVDYQALVGDSSDNIPGVALIGPKIARELLQKFGSLDEILKPENLDAHFGTKPSKRKTNLLEGREVAELSRKLATLRTDVPLEIDWESGRPSHFDYLALIPLFEQYNFRSMISKAEKMGSQNLLFEQPAQASAPAVAEKSVHVEVASSPAAREEIVSNLPPFGVSFEAFETEDILVFPPDLFCSTVCDEILEDATPALALFESRRTQLESFLNTHRAEIEDSNIVKTGFDLKIAYKIFDKLGIAASGPFFDILIAAYLLHSGEDIESLEKIVTLYSSLAPSFSNEKANSAEAIEALFRLFRQELRENHFETIAARLEFPLVRVLARMETAGIFVDKSRLKQISEEFHAQTDALRSELYQLIEGSENVSPETLRVNLNSPIQLRNILYDRFHLEVLRKTKTGPSTDAQTLEELSEKHPFPGKLLEYRQLVKLQNTYVDALPKLVSPIDGRIHTKFNQAVTATGRLSSSEPNLQNIPVRTEAGRLIRSAFVARPEEWFFVSADYSQVELRVLAHFCGDENLCSAFKNGEDIHTRVAGEIYDVPISEVTKDMRRTAKTVNFGVIYGQSAFGLAKQLKIPQSDARHFIQEYFAQFPSIATFLESVLDQARERGWVSTLFGRHRFIKGSVARDRAGQLNQAGRMAVNTVIQGTAADLIKLSMLKVDQRLRDERLDARLLLQIHDELLLEVPPHELAQVQTLLREEMTSVWTLNVPLKVDMEVAKTWDK